MLSASASSDTALSFSPVGELTRCGPGASSTMRYVPAAVRPTIWLSIATLSFEAPPKRSEEHTSELQSQSNLVCRLLLEKKKNTDTTTCTTSRQMAGEMVSLTSSLTQTV